MVALWTLETIPVFLVSVIWSPSAATFFMHASQKPFLPSSRHVAQMGILQPMHIVAASVLAW